MVSMSDDIDRRTVLAATGAGAAMGLTGIASGERPADGDRTAVVTAGVSHSIRGDKSDFEVWAVDDIPPYRIRKDRGAVAVIDHPDRDVIEAFRRSGAVADFRGHPDTAAVAAAAIGDIDGSGRNLARSIAGEPGPAHSLVTELGPQHRVIERVATDEAYEPPRVAVRPERDTVALDIAGPRGGQAVLTAGETVRRTLSEQQLALHTRDRGRRQVTVTPVLEARHHGRLRVVEDRPGGAPPGAEIGRGW